MTYQEHEEWVINEETLLNGFRASGLTLYGFMQTSRHTVEALNHTHDKLARYLRAEATRSVEH
jgi:hypothetical protein